MVAAFLKCFALLALLLMPVGMTVGAAQAHGSPMSGGGHCDEQPADPQPGTPQAQIDCAGCTALPVAEGPGSGAGQLPQSPTSIAVLAPIEGNGPELATPPPKRA